MKRKITGLIALLMIVVTASAQELKVKQFSANPTDNAAVKYLVNDANGQPCALILVGLAVSGATFEGDIVKVEQKDGGEYWVYMIEGANWIEVKTKDYLPLRYDFTDENGSTVDVVAKTTYVMQIEKPLIADNGPKGTVTITSNVRNADVYVDGVKLSSVTPFDYVGGEGTHIVELKAQGYNDEKTTIDVKLNRKQSRNVTMKAAGSFSLNGISYEMVKVPGGKFWMGSKKEDNKYSTFNYEKPAHQVTLRDYSIGKTEVTQALWQEVMGSNPSMNQGPELPVENVSWDDCQEFISKLNERCGTHFRLPTEAEWEYAAVARASDNAFDYSGSDKLSDVAHTGSSTTAPCSKRPNALGIYDMSGNVAEWCSDWLGKYTSAAAVNPSGPAKGVQKIVRGGSFKDDEWNQRNTYRGHFRPGEASKFVGLRLAQD